MNRNYKQAYEAPRMESFELSQSMTVLETGSVEASIEGPDFGSAADWELGNQHWGHARQPGYPAEDK